ncbi:MULTISPECIES: GNAT family N-acetyltransferase [Kitasatospora]|uniref:Putative acetyltransferase n=1 Tax=Kitasatospora setae (strain ATCC 33774 / DSM 43861 / JCM 3304 / KCC A-0304 / NBRC 14216 / KM-6054) TaxID=452652 RepID=E4N927_KITSK|nr:MULTISPECIES: GNAT family N-acetyltransferase [Kitasatospora]BAJ27708.1 putative acetyltransferase [Kitasatospora setae KM-6054]
MAEVRVRAGRPGDAAELVRLAGQVEQWFGPMVGEPGFHAALEEQLACGSALVATGAAVDGPLLGGLLVGRRPPVCHLHWLVVDAAARGRGVGRALVAEALARCPDGVRTVEVVTFGADHPGAVASGARVFYERLGFSPAEAAAPGPEGGSRQVYRRALSRAESH